MADFATLLEHAGHEIVCVRYAREGRVYNVAIECEDCNEVLVDFDNSDDADEDGED